MSHYRVRLGNSPIVHASLVPSGSWPYCEDIPLPGKGEDIHSTGDLVTCEVCREGLAQAWSQHMNVYEDSAVEYALVADREGPSRVRIIGRREVEDKGLFIRFVRKWEDGHESLAYYKVRRFIDLLIDGNATLQTRGGETWRLQRQLKNAN